MKINAAMSMLLGIVSAFDVASPAFTPVVHRTAGNTKEGRQMVSKRYRSSNVYAHVTNGAREVARRQRQMQRVRDAFTLSIIAKLKGAA
jgi:hypothetical protein